MGDAHSPWPDLALLDALLQREQMARSPDVWVNIHRLLFARAGRGQLPETPQAIANLLGPLVCKTPQQQQRMQVVIGEWLHGQQPQVQADLHSPEQAPAARWRKRIQRFDRRSRIALAGLSTFIVALALMIALLPPQPEVVLPSSGQQLAPEQTTPAEKATVSITDWVAPNLLPMPNALPANWQVWLQRLGWAGQGASILVFLLFLIWHYRRRTVLRNRAPSGERLLTRLNLNLRNDNVVAPFSGPEIVQAMSTLIKPMSQPRRHLDIEQSVIATAQQLGFFTPCYQQRDSRPGCILLVQSLHGSDQAAYFAELLVQAMADQRISVHSYRFRDDPRRLIPWIQPAEGADKTTLSLTQLAQRRGEERLIVISDWDILFQPYLPDKPQPWINIFNAWTRRIWLSPGYEHALSAMRAAQQSKLLNFHLLPFNSRSIPELVKWLSQEGDTKAPSGQTYADYLPPLLSATADSWLNPLPPSGIDLKRLDRQLRHYLGDDGWLLLQALAVFPKPLWPLPQVLDIQLFTNEPKPALRRRWFLRQTRRGQAKPKCHDEKQQREGREQRLQRISRLPWFRHAYMPDYLRKRLLRQLNRRQRRNIRTTWAGLLNALAHNPDADSIHLPIAVPKTHKRQLVQFLTEQPKHSALHDPIFANILLGGKLGLLDFRLPQTLARLLPGGAQWLDLRPALLAVVLTVVCVRGFNLLWENQAKQALTDLWQQRIEQQNAAWQVTLLYQPQTQPLAKALARSLQSVHFQVSMKPATNSTKSSQNKIDYPPNAKAVAERVAQSLAWSAYGADIALSASPDLNSNTLQIQLGQTYQHGAGFNDTLVYPYQKPINQPQPLVDFKEPAMVVIQPGQFLMGSPETEPGRYTNEGPQHKVIINYAFAIGKYEVTFDEYDQFADATGRKKPDDQGWGRGQRPVIYVSFNDAQAYTRWLSQQTGQNYRLPTEAEWEYAARAGITTAYWWGDEIGQNNAVCSDCGSKWDSKQTAPVGSFKANPFGLYDTAGNVWEWTLDCYHDNYTHAPADGSAWLEGECDRRVVRGGSWDSLPHFLRSAIRYWYGTGGAFNFLGFRVARAM